MNSPVFGWLLLLYLGFAAIASNPAGKPVARWSGGAAAFLAEHVEGAGVRSTVTIKGIGQFRFASGKLEAPPESRRVSSLDLDGALAGSYVVLFHSEQGLLRGPFSFDTPQHATASLKFIVTGVAPGVWEIWRNGWVVDTGVVVRAGEGVLYFQERPGSYFVRRLG